MPERIAGRGYGAAKGTARFRSACYRCVSKTDVCCWICASEASSPTIFLPTLRHKGSSRSWGVRRDKCEMGAQGSASWQGDVGARMGHAPRDDESVLHDVHRSAVGGRVQVSRFHYPRVFPARRFSRIHLSVGMTCACCPNASLAVIQRQQLPIC